MHLRPFLLSSTYLTKKERHHYLTSLGHKDLRSGDFISDFTRGQNKRNVLNYLSLASGVDTVFAGVVHHFCDARVRCRCALVCTT